MALSPLDIKNKNFANKRFGGYDKDEVDDFLDTVMNDYEELMQKNKSLDKDLKHSNEKLEYFNQLKENMNETLITAKSMEKQIKANAAAEADIVVREARNEADHITTDARTKAKEILTDAIDKAKQLAKETDDLKAKTRVFHQRLVLMLETALKGTQTSDWDEILKPFSDSVGEDHQIFKEVLDGKTTADTLDKGAESEVQSQVAPIAEEVAAPAEETPVVEAPAVEETTAPAQETLAQEEGTLPAVEPEVEPSYIDHLEEEVPASSESLTEPAPVGEEQTFPSEVSSEIPAPTSEENQTIS